MWPLYGAIAATYNTIKTAGFEKGDFLKDVKKQITGFQNNRRSSAVIDKSLHDGRRRRKRIDRVRRGCSDHNASALKNILISLPLRSQFCYSAYSMFVEFQFGEVYMTLTKALIAKKIADDCGFLKGEATEIVEKLLDIIKAQLVAGEEVMISRFGKWSVKSKRARRGRKPKTGEPIVLNARRVVTWKYSTLLKKAMNLS